MRICSRCKKKKPEEEFYHFEYRKVYYCKSCCSEIGKESYQRNKEKRKARSRKQYYETDYLKKKYLKRYYASLERLRNKLQEALANPPSDKKNYARKIQGYERSIEKFKNKIKNLETTTHP